MAELFRVEFCKRNDDIYRLDPCWMSKRRRRGQIKAFLATVEDVEKCVNIPDDVDRLDVVACDRKVVHSFPATVACYDRPKCRSLEVVVEGVGCNGMNWSIWDMPVPQSLLRKLRGKRFWMYVEY